MSTLRANALEGVDAKNSITIVAGAGNITTTNVQEGLNKCWINFDGRGTISTRDSFNHSSVTDNGTGDFSPVMTNAMGNINYAQAAAMSRQTNCDTDSINTNNSTGNDVAPTTTTYRFGALQFGTGGVDVTYVNFQIAGDLA